MIEQQEKDLEERRMGIEAEISNKKEQIRKLEQDEQELIPGLDPEVLFKFERIIRNKMGRGIVAIKGGVCNGCHMILPIQFTNMVREGEDIVFCPYCSRILFYEESAGEELDYFDNEDTGSLSDLDELDEDEYDEEEEDEESAGMEFEE
jgi:predicted  nucleic acid-binding Zn-ribbon protein